MLSNMGFCYVNLLFLKYTSLDVKKILFYLSLNKRSG